jgi:gluconolactonase
VAGRPGWFGDHDCLLVSDLPNDRIVRWSEHGGLAVFRQPSGFANGHTRDREGRLIGCSWRGPYNAMAEFAAIVL